MSSFLLCAVLTQARVIPLLKSRFELGDAAVEMHDLFLIRYRGDEATAQNELKMHTDGTTLSFSVALSPPDKYAGGGIEFDIIETPVRAPQGGTPHCYPAKQTTTGREGHVQ